MNNFLISLASTFIVCKGPLTLKVAVKSMPPDWWVVVAFFSPNVTQFADSKILMERIQTMLE